MGEKGESKENGGRKEVSGRLEVGVGRGIEVGGDHWFASATFSMF